MIDKITQWFKKQLSKLSTNSDGSCRCTTTRGLYLDQRQLNRTIAGAVIVGLFLFVGGYFWGQHSAIDQVLHAVERDSFADQIYYSMCPANENKEGESADSEEQEETEPAQKNDTAAPAENEQVAVSEPAEEQKTYFAQVAGFGQQARAQRYANQLQQRGFAVHVVKRISKSGRGRSVAWYQVVTDDFHDKQTAEQTIAQLKTQERLRSVTLVER